MAAQHPEIENLSNVTRRHAEEYISLLRSSGAFEKVVTWKHGERELQYKPNNDFLSPRTINARHKAIKAVFARLKEDA